MELDRDKTVSRAQAIWALSERIAALARLKALEAALPADLPGAWDFALTPDGEVQFGVTLAGRGELAAWVRALRRLPGVTAGRRRVTADRRFTVHPFRWGGGLARASEPLCLVVPTAPDDVPVRDELPVWVAACVSTHVIETLDFDTDKEPEG